jgi:hypothetical protein
LVNPEMRGGQKCENLAESWLKLLEIRLSKIRLNIVTLPHISFIIKWLGEIDPALGAKRGKSHRIPIRKFTWRAADGEPFAAKTTLWAS